MLTASMAHTHCTTSHLTMFAGGIQLLKVKIDARYEFTFMHTWNKNIIIYATLVFLFVANIFLAVWSRFADLKEAQKYKTRWLKDNKEGDDYYYEVLVYTGDQNEAATRSKV